MALSEAVPRFLTLRFPDFALDEEALRSLVNDRTRMIVLNTPMNPTGRVFSREELQAGMEAAPAGCSATAGSTPTSPAPGSEAACASSKSTMAWPRTRRFAMSRHWVGPICMTDPTP